MAGESDTKGNCFTIIWKIENASYWWDAHTHISSPSFTVDEIRGTQWILDLDLAIREKYDVLGFWLKRLKDNKSAESIAIDCEFAFLAADGTALKTYEKKNSVVHKDVFIGTCIFEFRCEVFFARRSEFLPQDTLTARCRIWKSIGEMSKNVQCCVRTRIPVEKISFVWSIKDFATLEAGDLRTHEIQSLRSGELLMSLELFLTGGVIYDERIHLKIVPNYRIIKISTFRLSILDTSKNSVKCFEDEFWHADCHDCKYFTLCYTKSDLVEKKSVFLPGDVLSILCECAFAFGDVEKEIETTNIDCSVIEKKVSDNCSLDKEKELPVPKDILINDFRSMLSDTIHSDIKLKTSHRTYPAHKCVLSVRSPVFKAMFSNDMKEKNTDCVDIEDLNDDTILRLLRYIYSAEIDELEWASATELYEAADKYQILNLKDVCSSFLKSHLCVNNSCEALVLADMHQDDDLKSFVQGFILRYGKDIINSEAWEQLTKANLKLAYETIRLKFKE